MKAALIREHGPVEKVEIATDLPVPEPGPDEVRLRVHAAALNYLDIWVRNGWPGIKLTLPHSLGADAAGTIDALGAHVHDWQIGARVAVDPTLSCGECEFCRTGWENRCAHFRLLGEHVSGTFAEFITVPARNLIALPDHVSFAEAAAASLVFVTAWHSLITRANLRPGESVLVIGAGGLGSPVTAEVAVNSPAMLKTRDCPAPSTISRLSRRKEPVAAMPRSCGLINT